MPDSIAWTSCSTSSSFVRSADSRPLPSTHPNLRPPGSSARSRRRRPRTLTPARASVGDSIGGRLDPGAATPGTCSSASRNGSSPDRPCAIGARSSGAPARAISPKRGGDRAGGNGMTPARSDSQTSLPRWCPLNATVRQLVEHEGCHPPVRLELSGRYRRAELPVAWRASTARERLIPALTRRGHPGTRT